jgi:glycerate dehydrogenase
VKESEKLVLTPHIGWASQEARRVLVQKLADNIKSFLNRSGEEL